MASLKSALLTYYLHVGEFPTETTGLRALEERPTNLPPSKEWKGPYTDGSCHIDPWGNPYRYCFSAGEDGPVITISSNGPDGLMNTADGIAISFPNFQALDYLSLEELEQADVDNPEEDGEDRRTPGDR